MRGLPKLKRAAPALSRGGSRAALWGKVAYRALGLGGPGISKAPSAETASAPAANQVQTGTAPAGTAAVGFPGVSTASSSVAQAPAPETEILSSATERCSTGGEDLMDLVRRLPFDILERAVTHSSWVPARTGSYERLEFLGDSVLGLAIASTLYERYPAREEGELARIKAFVVSRPSCVQVARCLDLPGLILKQAPAPEQKRREAAGNSTILGNVLEALIGACYLTHGYDVTALAVIEAFEEQIRYAITAHVDHKTTLQELLAPRGIQPVYRLVDEQGPPHARTFTSEVTVDGEVRGRGKGTTIKMSEQAAAREALASLRGDEPEPEPEPSES